MAAVEQGILDILATENVDASRIYLCGLSMGGFGTWDLLSRRPEWFAAAGPICGGANKVHAPRYVGRSIWNWHGAADEVLGASELGAVMPPALRLIATLLSEAERSLVFAQRTPENTTGFAAAFEERL